MLIACTKPYLVLYNPGYCRISLNDFNMDDYNTKEGKITHMTNNSVQKKHPEYKDRKEETIIDMNTLYSYLAENSDSHGNAKMTENEIKDKLTTKIKEIMRIVFLQTKDKLDKSYGCFELLGWDFMVDQNYNPYLIEININPALYTDTSTQKAILPSLIDDTIDIVLKLHKTNQTKATEGDFNDVVECLTKKIEGIDEAKYKFEILF